MRNLAVAGNPGVPASSITPSWTLGDLLFSFKGRINRGKWWATIGMMWGLSLGYWALVFLSVTVAGDAPAALLSLPVAVLFIAIAVTSVWAGFAIGIKRLHDLGHTGHWMWIIYGLPVVLTVLSIALNPAKQPLINSRMFLLAMLVTVIAGVVQFIWLGCLRGTRGANAYGADPIPDVA